MTFAFISVAFLLGIWAGAGWSMHECRRLKNEIAELEGRNDWLSDKNAELCERARELIEHTKNLFKEAKHE